jgi:hypothetical protein
MSKARLQTRLLVFSSLLASACDVPTTFDGAELEDPLGQVSAELSGSVTYTIKPGNSGLCVDVTGASKADGANIEQWTCNGHTNQQWTARDVGGGVFEIAAISSGKCLDVVGGGLSSGVNVQQLTCQGTSSQRWKANSLGGSRYQLVSQASGKCLDVAGSSLLPGGNIQQWTCNNHTSQTFSFLTGSATSGGLTGSGGSSGESTGANTTPPTGNFPARFAAPYVATWDDTNLVNLANATGNHFWTLAFIIDGGGCNPKWNGDTSLGGNNYRSYIANLKKAGGDVIVSFGGASGTEMAVGCADVASTQAAYQKVISQFHLSYIDLDVESGQESDTRSVDRRNKALHNLQIANPGLRVSYTLAVERSGLGSAQRSLLANARSNGVRVDVVNIMAMDYGPCYSDMGQAAVDAARATRTQIADLGLAAKVGVTPMIGTNDVTCERFSTNDARVLVSFAQANSFIGTLAYWVQDADPTHAFIDVFKTFH